MGKLGRRLSLIRRWRGDGRAVLCSCLYLLGAPTELHSQAHAKVLEALSTENVTVPHEGTSFPTMQDTECSYAEIQIDFSYIFIAKSGLS